jgi:hypothetical protein
VVGFATSVPHISHWTIPGGWPGRGIKRTPLLTVHTGRASSSRIAGAR